MKSEKVNYVVASCFRNDIRDFMEMNHYSGNINGVISDYCFCMLDDNGDIVGAAIFGRMAMANQWRRFGENQSDVIELRRLACSPDAVRNSESYMIGKMIKWLRKNTSIKVIVSYADAEYGHSGIIYKASNFRYEGFRKGAKVIVFEGKRYHDKTIRTKYNGALKPYAQKIKDALLDGRAEYRTTAGKHCYVFSLVALSHGRQYIGCELNEEYGSLQEERISKEINKQFADML